MLHSTRKCRAHIQNTYFSYWIFLQSSRIKITFIFRLNPIIKLFFLQLDLISERTYNKQVSFPFIILVSKQNISKTQGVELNIHDARALFSLGRYTPSVQGINFHFLIFILFHIFLANRAQFPFCSSMFY